ncbi:MAG: cupredoxin domain-containing protein [Armatimonadota bacterium]|nr:cupredoxin domain-containing protein [Armatimonadota bacterium]MDR5702496.1 cupredoxin domain-containing protein [Armatimonadota bacterium]
MRRADVVAAIVVFAIVVLLPVGIFAYQFREKPHPEGVREITVIIHTFEHGGFQPARIVVRKGERVRLKLMSYDVTHSFQLLDYDIDTDLIFPGQPVVVEFVASEEGTFPFQCNIKCSPSHQNMVGQLIVEP